MDVLEMQFDTHGGNLAATLKSLGLEKAPPLRLDFSVNLNPLGPSDTVARLPLNAETAIGSYPPVEPVEAEKAIAVALGLPPQKIVLCSGATEAFELILQAYRPKSAAWTPPSYSGYQEIFGKLRIEDIPIPAKLSGLDFKTDFAKLKSCGAESIFLCSPSNPSGQCIQPSDIIDLAASTPKSLIVVDESFMDFTGRAAELSLLKRDCPANIAIVKSLTKFHCIPGLRLGFAYASESLCAEMRRLRLPWTVNGLAQAVAPLLLQDRKYAEESVAETTRLRKILVAGLANIAGIETCPSEANFVLCRLAQTSSADSVQGNLLAQGIMVRSCAKTSGLGPQWIRLAVRPEDETRQILEALPHALAGTRPAKSVEARKAKAIMVVGTTSDSGKSVSATALCRIFSDMGVKVAPFKAQNMSLNSFVTKEGGEMGRAQVVQALAARVEPHTDMNPVLLKPLGDSRSQVIIDGQPFCNANAREYYTKKDFAGARARAAFDRLASRYDLIVLEGAGSPTEINLLENDFVNMRMAEHAQAPAILVADIDRGGVFASVFGTIKLLPPKWRRLIAGIVINKFRGDKSLLDSGIAQIEELTGVPVLGVVPYIHSLDVDEEDSLGLKKRNGASKGALDIAVIRLPMISNFTDFAALEAAPSVSVRYVSSAKHLGQPDLIVIPGSKNTIHDMLFLNDSGLGDRIMDYSRGGKPVIGICGGYQMLGERIDDPLGVEGPDKSVAGLGLLPVATVMERGKELAQVSGIANDALPFLKAACPFQGYEIHCGKTVPAARGNAKNPLSIDSRSGVKCLEAAGDVSKDGLVFGSYIHGIFDSDELRAALLKWLCERKGADPAEMLAQPPRAQVQEAEICRLSKTFKDSVDMERIKSWLALPASTHS